MFLFTCEFYPQGPPCTCLHWSQPVEHRSNRTDESVLINLIKCRDHRCCLATEQSQTNGIHKNRKTTRAWVVLPWRRYARSTTLPEKYSHVNPYHLLVRGSEKSASKQVDCQLVLIKQAPFFVNDVLSIRTKMISPILWNFIIWGKKPRNWIEKHIQVCWNNGIKL